MAQYILVAETGADIPSELAKRYGIEIVPMHVSFGAESKDDGSFPPDEIFEFYERTKTLPKTSGSTPGDFEAAFDRIHSQHPGKTILHLAYSAVTTCSYNSALIAADNRDYVVSIDTKHVSAGQAMVVLRVARYLEQRPDCPLEELVQVVDKLCRRCRMAFLPGDLAYLKAGGRVSNAAYLGAKILSLHPLIEILDGKLVSTKKYRGGTRQVVSALIKEYVAEQDLERDAVAFVYSGRLEPAIREDAQAQAEALGFREILWFPTGGVISAHCGPGSFGIIGYSRK